MLTSDSWWLLNNDSSALFLFSKTENIESTFEGVKMRNKRNWVDCSNISSEISHEALRTQGQ
jgi:hypothetical protein